MLGEHNFLDSDNGFRCGLSASYDLELDQRLSEETTVLVESYTVSITPFYLKY
jgi:hypothetical protein